MRGTCNNYNFDYIEIKKKYLNIYNVCFIGKIAGNMISLLVK